MTICGRCHRGATRLIGRHLCISCYNAQLVACKNRNRKGTAPKKLTAEMLARRTISYLAGGRLKTKTIDLSVAMTELVVAVLRDETHAPQFGWRNTSMDWLRDDVIYDRAIGEIGDEGVPVADAAAVADSEQEQAVAPNVASAQADAVEPVPAPLPDVVESVEADPYDSLRDAVEQLEHDLPVSMPTRPHRSATKMRQQPRRQVRVSAMTANLLRSIGALPPPAPPVVVPVPQPVSSYSATLYAV